MATTVNVTGYTVSVPVTSANASNAVQSMVLPGLIDGRSYVFQVAAVNAAGTGAASVLSPSVVPAGVPSAPQHVSATSFSSQQSTVSFYAPGYLGGVALRSYTVACVVGTGGGSACSPLTVLANASSLTAASGSATGQLSVLMTGLTNGQSYVFAVTASNVAGSGAAGQAAAAIVPAAPPSAPAVTCARAAQSGDSVPLSSSLVYYTPPASTNGAPVTNYTLTATPYFVGSAPSLTLTMVAPSSPLVLPVAPSCSGWLSSGTSVTASTVGSQLTCYAFNVPTNPAFSLPSTTGSPTLLNSGNPITLSSGAAVSSSCESDKQFYLPPGSSTWQSTFTDPSTGHTVAFAQFVAYGSGQLYYVPPSTAALASTLQSLLSGARVRVDMICAAGQYSFVELTVNFSNGTLIFPQQTAPTNAALGQQTAYVLSLQANNAAGSSPVTSVMYVASPWNVCFS